MSVSFRELVSNPSWKKPQKRLKYDPLSTLLRNGCPRRIYSWSWVRWNGEKKERRRHLRLVHYELSICNSSEKNAKPLHTVLLRCDCCIEFSAKRREFMVQNHVFSFLTLTDFNAWAFAVQQGVRNPKNYYDFSYAEKIGSGAFSQVLLVTDRATGEDVAMKIVDKSTCTKSALIAATNEALVSARVQNDTIVQCYDVFDTPQKLYLALEYASAGSLEDPKYLRASEVEVATVMRRILEALTYMEINGLVHRDLKPENILIRSSGASWSNQVVLTDLGLCALVGNSKGLHQVCGTLQYAAPEVVTWSSGEYGTKVDVWSAGCIAYYLLSRGELPFDGDTTGDVLRAIKSGKYFMDGSVWSNVSAEAKSFCRSLLQYSPNTRLSAFAAMHHPWLCPRKSTNRNRKRSCKAVLRSVLAVVRLRRICGYIGTMKSTSPRTSSSSIWGLLRISQTDQFTYGRIDSISTPNVPRSPRRRAGNSLDDQQNALRRANSLVSYRGRSSI